MVTLYRKDDLEGFEVFDIKDEQGNVIETAREYANRLISTAGYTESYKKAEAGSRDVGGANYTGGGATTNQEDKTEYSETTGREIGQALYSFLPPEVLDEFASQWAKSGDADVAIGATRQTKAWKDNYSHLLRKDGSLVMSELAAESTIATYKATLAEVGIADFTDFEDEFKQMVGGHETGDPVSGDEFQQRVDLVWSGVKNQIPEVEKLFREKYGINVDAPTIFGALVNDKIQDKVLKGDIATLQLQAEASSRGFTTTFARFQELQNLGLTQQQASGLYEAAGGIIEQARTVGRTLDISTLEEAATGDIDASKKLGLIAAEAASMSSVGTGAAKKDGKVSGLIET
tara:strand:- start:400 stop:1437 length:1038 start_codon:yes stop_codon:yes gene_type:complete